MRDKQDKNNNSFKIRSIGVVCNYEGYTKLYRKIPWDVYRGMELP